MIKGQFALSEDQRCFLVLCLEVARERFAEHVNTSRDLKNHRLVQQFEGQVSEAEAMRARLENAEHVTIGPEVE